MGYGECVCKHSGRLVGLCRLLLVGQVPVCALVDCCADLALSRTVTRFCVGEPSSTWCAPRSYSLIDSPLPPPLSLSSLRPLPPFCCLQATAAAFRADVAAASKGDAAAAARCLATHDSSSPSFLDAAARVDALRASLLTVEDYNRMVGSHLNTPAPFLPSLPAAHARHLLLRCQCLPAADSMCALVTVLCG